MLAEEGTEEGKRPANLRACQNPTRPDPLPMVGPYPCHQADEDERGARWVNGAKMEWAGLGRWDGVEGAREEGGEGGARRGGSSRGGGSGGKGRGGDGGGGGGSGGGDGVDERGDGTEGEEGTRC